MKNLNYKKENNQFIIITFSEKHVKYHIDLKTVKVAILIFNFTSQSSIKK